MPPGTGWAAVIPLARTAARPRITQISAPVRPNRRSPDHAGHRTTAPPEALLLRWADQPRGRHGRGAGERQTAPRRRPAAGCRQPCEPAWHPASAPCMARPRCSPSTRAGRRRVCRARSRTACARRMPRTRSPCADVAVALERRYPDHRVAASASCVATSGSSAAARQRPHVARRSRSAVLTSSRPGRVAGRGTAVHCPWSRSS